MSRAEVAPAEAATPVDPLIELRGLTKYFVENESFLNRFVPGRQSQTVHAVDGVDMAIERGETRGLVGESGCGKSTLARLIVRLLDPTEGSIVIDGTDIANISGRGLREFRKKVQIIFQDPFSSLNPRYTVRRTLTEPMGIHGIGDSKADRNERAVDLIEQVGLDEDHLDRYPHEFSGGQRQRIGIARALSVDPEILVADEPTSALDVSIQADILNMVKRIQAEHDLTILFISHDLSVVRAISDTISVMYLGEIVETAAAEALFASPKHPYSEMLLSSIPSPDPKNRTEFERIEGEVPDPIDPPAGCRFHPRCPAVIQPDDLGLDHEVWRRVFRFKKDIENEKVIIENVQARIEASSPDGFIAERFGEGLTDGPARVLRSALEDLLDDDPEAAVRGMDEVFASTCERRNPATRSVDGHAVDCHLYEPDAGRVAPPGPDQGPTDA